ncbi:MAG: protealysin inhibitor emfourin [Phycicoccus sp.]
MTNPLPAPPPSSARRPRPGSTSAVISFVPPYLLEALASSGDEALATRARTTLDLDAGFRSGRTAPDARPPAGSTPATPSAAGLQRTVHDGGGGTDLPGAKVRGESDPATDDREVTEAYDGLGATWTLWQESYGRDSLDGNGMPLLATVHYGQNYANAFWDGTQMVFGDGDGEVFLPFTRSLDVIAHELAHGVTQYTSNLTYQGQSGALNESVSDVFGALVVQRARGQAADAADWLIGADLLADGVQGKALRSMAEPGTAYDDPRLGKDPQPGHWRDYVETTDDNGGVHINSGIPNKAFHVVATTLGGNAWESAGQIWVDTVTGEISPDCDFATFAKLTVEAAGRRFGETSREADAVRAGWDAVGVAPPSPSSTAGSPGGAPASEPAPTSDIDPDDGTEVSVRRTGGLAGMVRERTVALRELPGDDTAAWRSLLAQRTLQALATADPRPVPDAFSYGVRCPAPEVDVTLPEQVLSDDVRGLLERTLTVGGSDSSGPDPAGPGPIGAGPTGPGPIGPERTGPLR